jgi:hypothetical protein
MKFTGNRSTTTIAISHAETVIGPPGASSSPGFNGDLWLPFLMPGGCLPVQITETCTPRE